MGFETTKTLYFLISYNQYLMTKWLTQELVKLELFKLGRGLP